MADSSGAAPLEDAPLLEDASREPGTQQPDATSSAAAPVRQRLPFLSWLQPSRGVGAPLSPVFETGVEYGLSLRCDSEEVEAVTFTLFDASTYKSWCGARCAPRQRRVGPSPQLLKLCQVERDHHRQGCARRGRHRARLVARCERPGA